jgi:hypothetical protein
MDLLAVHYNDAVQGFTLENIVDLALLSATSTR